jgi:cytochrome c oxidase subunit 2
MRRAFLTPLASLLVVLTMSGEVLAQADTPATPGAGEQTAPGTPGQQAAPATPGAPTGAQGTPVTPTGGAVQAIPTTPTAPVTPPAPTGAAAGEQNAPAGQAAPAAPEQPVAPAGANTTAPDQPANVPTGVDVPGDTPGAVVKDEGSQTGEVLQDFVRTSEFIVTGGGTVWLPEQSSVIAPDVDWMFDVVMWLSVISFLGITIAVVYFVWKYRARPGHKTQPSPHHNDVMETVWTVIPSIICVGLFLGGWRGYVDMTTPPKHALEIQVTARKWSWEFTHPNGVKDSVLHVPAGRSVRLVMKSEDVLHSFFVPKFRVKQDVLPRRYTQVWFKAETPTVSREQELQSVELNDTNKALVPRQLGHRLFCTEYCGTDHSLMKTRVVVHNPGGYDNYLAFMKEVQDAAPPVERGQAVYSRLCVACHTIDGTVRIGPSFKGIWGETHNFVDGSTATVDENYVRDSILNPQAKIRQGFPPSMPSFQGQLSDKEIVGVIEYLKSLKE